MTNVNQFRSAAEVRISKLAIAGEESKNPDSISSGTIRIDDRDYWVSVLGSKISVTPSEFFFRDCFFKTSAGEAQSCLQGQMDKIIENYDKLLCNEVKHVQDKISEIGAFGDVCRMREFSENFGRKISTYRFLHLNAENMPSAHFGFQAVRGSVLSFLKPAVPVAPVASGNDLKIIDDINNRLNITKRAFGISGGQTDGDWYEGADGHSLPKFLADLRANPRYSVAAWPAPARLQGLSTTDEAVAELDAWIGFLYKNISKICIIEKLSLDCMKEDDGGLASRKQFIRKNLSGQAQVYLVSRGGTLEGGVIF